MDKIKITKEARELFHDREPDEAYLVGEYPHFFLCEGIWKHMTAEKRYKFCLNKPSLYCGSVEAVNLNTMERLGCPV